MVVVLVEDRVGARCLVHPGVGGAVVVVICGGSIRRGGRRGSESATVTMIHDGSVDEGAEV